MKNICLLLLSASMGTLLRGQSAVTPAHRNGWFEGPHNRRFELYLQSATKHGKHTRNVALCVENRVFDAPALTHALTFRCVGAWASSDSQFVFRSECAIGKRASKKYKWKNLNLKML